MLPAREAECAIRALHRNSRGFRLLTMFLLFYALYFTMVFTGVDIPFERAVEQGLQNHVDSVKFGAEGDRGYNDVISLSDVHQWIQAFFRETYSGTEIEDICVPCAIRPPDDFCDSCNILEYVNATALDSTSGTYFYYNGTSTDCQTCVASWYCGPIEAQACNVTLSGGSLADFNITEHVEQWDASHPSLTSSSTISPHQIFTEEMLSEYINMTALAEFDLTPEGGVSASTGHMTVQNVSECKTWDFIHNGITENMLRIRQRFKVGYNGGGYIANTNRIVGGMLLTFKRRIRVPECESSMGYYDTCLSGKTAKEEISIEEQYWENYRPTTTIPYNEDAGGYTVFIDTGGFNTGPNFGYCTLLMLEDLELLANNTHSVSVQLFTFNGHERTAYGHVLVDFKFSDGGEVTVTDSVTSYVLRATFDSDRDRARRITAAIFTLVALGTMFGDFREFRRNRRVKARLQKRACCCSCTFHVLIIINMLCWMGWAAIGYIPIETEIQLDVPEKRSGPLDQLCVRPPERLPSRYSHWKLKILMCVHKMAKLTKGILLQHQLALFAGFYKQLFLATALAGLYRLLFQKLTFHRRMSIVTDTLSRASTNLGHFLFVFLLVLAVFVEVTWLLVGKGSVHFTCFGDAWESMIRVSLGESENFYPEILEAQPELGVVLVVLYQVLVVVLLLNVVVAILLEAYRGVVVGMRDEDTIFQALTAFVGMTLLSWRTRVRWASRYLRWRVSRRRVLAERPSLKVALQESTGVIGVDGLPVMMVRRPDPSKAALVERQLSYNCPRYITVTEMMALIGATPVPAFVAERIVRRIVHHWVFHSDEKITSRGYSSGSRSGEGGKSEDSCDSLPMLRRRKI